MRVAVAVLAHEVHARLGGEVDVEEVLARRVLGVERVVAAPRGEPAVGDLDLDLREVAGVEQVEDQRAQVERLHRGLEARLRRMQHERAPASSRRSRRARRARAAASTASCARARRGSSPTSRSEWIACSASPVTRNIASTASLRVGPLVAGAQVALEAVRRLEADALDVEREVAVRLRRRANGWRRKSSWS